MVPHDFDHIPGPRSELRQSPEFDPDFRNHRPSAVSYALIIVGIVVVWWLLS